MNSKMERVCLRAEQPPGYRHRKNKGVEKIAAGRVPTKHEDQEVEGGVRGPTTVDFIAFTSVDCLHDLLWPSELNPVPDD